MIEVQTLARPYGDKIAVEHLAFSDFPGNVVGFLVPNGAGKSTTLTEVPPSVSLLVDPDPVERVEYSGLAVPDDVHTRALGTKPKGRT